VENISFRLADLLARQVLVVKGSAGFPARWVYLTGEFAGVNG